MFKGKNLILLTAEGFSPYAIDQELTPTLYKLTHEGFVALALAASPPFTQLGMMPVVTANSPPQVDWVQSGW